uniref:NADH-ubiquinone oxidoreductase chain 6 n=1 Tax=Polydrusus marginatus TaxID=1046238 RepID=S4S359_9CUCU|nr:NADH dehydrogenase subunit 6 [Polydrusus marginatus]
MFYISISWMMAIIFTFLNHPISFGFIILLQTITFSLITGILNLDFWFSYILFLIMIGGMLILFIYMTSIASNEKFNFSKKMTFFSLMFLMTTILMNLMLDNFLYMKNLNNYDLNPQNMLNMNLSMNKFFNSPNMMIMILLMIYLLITLIAIVKITQSKMGPLRPY